MRSPLAIAKNTKLLYVYIIFGIFGIIFLNSTQQYKYH